jgi:dihydroorotate dehydrogenase (fumarate)
VGIPVKNPLIVGSSSLTKNIGTIRKLEDEGAAAVVLSSLLEETIQLQSYKTDRDKSYFDKIGADVGNIFPNADNEQPEEHLMWARKAKATVDIPVIASLNCTNVETWVEWAGKLEETGVDGLELNFYAIHTDKSRAGAEIENYEVDAVKRSLMR